MQTKSNDDLSQTLRQLKVAAPSLDRDRLLFEAGRRSVKLLWTWPMVTAASLLITATMGLLVWRTPSVMEPVVYVQTTQPLAATDSREEPISTSDSINVAVSFVMLRQEMFTNNSPHRLTNISSGKPTPILTAGSFHQQMP